MMNTANTLTPGSLVPFLSLLVIVVAAELPAATSAAAAQLLDRPEDLVPEKVLLVVRHRRSEVLGPGTDGTVARLRWQ